MVASTPTTVPLMTVPFFNSIVTISRFSFCRNLTSFIMIYRSGGAVVDGWIDWMGGQRLYMDVGTSSVGGWRAVDDLLVF